MRRISVDETVSQFEQSIDELAQKIGANREEWTEKLGADLVDSFVGRTAVPKKLFKQWQDGSTTITAAQLEKSLDNRDQAHVVSLGGGGHGDDEEDDLGDDVAASLLKKVAVIKLSGGLGTSMKCPYPKGLIPVSEDLTLLDLTTKQIRALNQKYDVKIPLLLMTSFCTQKQLEEVLKPSREKLEILTFLQSCQPRITADFHVPLPLRNEQIDKKDWCPPGHGDFYESFNRSGLLDQMIERDIEWALVSNIDNAGATPDPQIIAKVEKLHQEQGVDFFSEVTRKTLADVKGGVFIKLNGSIRLIESSQIPEDKVSDFKGTSVFKYFNTNNSWIHLKSLKELIGQSKLETDVIVNQKILENNLRIIQLESAYSSAIKCFSNPRCLEVERDRFVPIKKCDDLVPYLGKLVKIDSSGFLKLANFAIPLVKLGSNFADYKEFKARIPDQINVVDLIHLTVNGDVRFGKNVTLKGNVIIIAPKGGSIAIPNGSVIENQVITGSLSIDEH